MNEWAIAGVDLHLDLAGGTGARAGLEDALRGAVRDGRLAPGTRLPSSRTLAKDLGVARNTVADAYGQLVAEGWLTARQGSGTRVGDGWRPTGPPAAPPRGGRARAAAPHPNGTADPARAPEQPAGPPWHREHVPYDLRPGSPDLGSFPRAAWSAAARRALAAAPNDALGYTDPRGRPELREALAAYLGRVRGVRTAPELVVVCTGFVQAAGLIGRALQTTGSHRVAVEALGYPHTLRILRKAGLTTVPLTVDDDGAQVRDLDTRVDAVLLTPAHQFPHGAPLSPARRTAAVAWARDTGGLVVEDDYDGEFRYDRQPVGALQGLAPEHVVYAGTASKSLAPGLRLAWLALPPALVEPVLTEKLLADHQSPVLDQLTLAELIVSGNYDRHVRRMRLHYRRRRDRLVTALAARAPAVRVSGIAAGLHAVLRLPPGTSAGALVARAREHGLALQSVADFGGTGDDAIVVGYGAPPEHAFAGSLDVLCALLAAHTA
ncbi:MocR-like pyridoxine biosynthesis transcription factor PdxR [Actinacidiphila glaucinigra]|uniref:GntR family transcriptional regulator / MocR family aminotransferase n=1 Tax=Actinacidiphila glaucinigra TaxID=235986 RepID=A0A239FG08_9ACTN|nr:PLP-dependent aminotransferase family protein [Actinacidiphila glaucinigra]SNS55092.1 GntR family transcriptional regulator / MocR family aminotransferase [Actinacidiphila glaucinigra]